MTGNPAMQDRRSKHKKRISALLRVAYAMSYSVSSCMILQWAYQSLYLIVREFHASYLKEKVWQGYGF